MGAIRPRPCRACSAQRRTRRIHTVQLGCDDSRLRMKAIVMHRYGPPDVLEYETVPDPEPRAGEIRIRDSRRHGQSRARRELAGRETSALAEPFFRSSRASIAPASSMRSDPPSRAGERECGSPPPASCRSTFAPRMATATRVQSDMMGIKRPGGFAEMVAVPACAAIELPDGARLSPRRRGDAPRADRLESARQRR